MHVLDVKQSVQAMMRNRPRLEDSLGAEDNVQVEIKALPPVRRRRSGDLDLCCCGDDCGRNNCDVLDFDKSVFTPRRTGGETRGARAGGGASCGAPHARRELKLYHRQAREHRPQQLHSTHISRCVR